MDEQGQYLQKLQILTLTVSNLSTASHASQVARLPERTIDQFQIL